RIEKLPQGVHFVRDARQPSVEPVADRGHRIDGGGEEAVAPVLVGEQREKNGNQRQATQRHQIRRIEKLVPQSLAARLFRRRRLLSDHQRRRRHGYLRAGMSRSARPSPESSSATPISGASSTIGTSRGWMSGPCQPTSWSMGIRSGSPLRTSTARGGPTVTSSSLPWPRRCTRCRSPPPLAGTRPFSKRIDSSKAKRISSRKYAGSSASSRAVKCRPSRATTKRTSPAARS